MNSKDFGRGAITIRHYVERAVPQNERLVTNFVHFSGTR